MSAASGSRLGYHRATGSRLAEDRPGLAACVHCGLCLPACPTFSVLRDENDSPRGRIYLMRLKVDGRVSARGAFATHIDRCLGCRACEAACPAGVRFGSLLERAREDRLGGVGPSFGRGLAWCFTGPLSPFTYWVLRALRGTGVAAVGGSFRARIGMASAALAATASVNRRRTRRGDVEGRQTGPGPRSTGPGPRSVERRRTGAEPGSRPPPETFALLEGCVMKGLFGHVHDATRRVLRACGYVEREAFGQACCGALHAHAGVSGTARRLARQNIEAFERSGARWFVVNSAGCGAAMKEYPDWLSDTAEWSERARPVAEATCDVTRLVARAPSRPEAALRLNAAYDAPCHLTYGLGDAESPLEALSAVEDLSVELLPSADRCCGGAGLYALQQAELSGRILEAKLEEIQNGGYEAVITGNPGCVMQIGAGLRRRRSWTKVVHPVEILDRGIREAAEARAGHAA